MELKDLLDAEDDEAIDEYLNEQITQHEIEMEEFYVGYMDLLGLKDKMNTKSDEKFQEWCNYYASLVDSVIDENIYFITERN